MNFYLHMHFLHSFYMRKFKTHEELIYAEKKINNTQIWALKIISTLLSINTTISSSKSKVKYMYSIYLCIERVSISALKTTFDMCRFWARFCEKDSRFCFPYAFLKCICIAHFVHIMMTHSTILLSCVYNRIYMLWRSSIF